MGRNGGRNLGRRKKRGAAECPGPGRWHPFLVVVNDVAQQCSSAHPNQPVTLERGRSTHNTPASCHFYILLHPI